MLRLGIELYSLQDHIRDAIAAPGNVKDRLGTWDNK
jgi:hypothetical protein